MSDPTDYQYLELNPSQPQKYTQLPPEIWENIIRYLRLLDVRSLLFIKSVAGEAQRALCKQVKITTLPRLSNCLDFFSTHPHLYLLVATLSIKIPNYKLRSLSRKKPKRYRDTYQKPLNLALLQMTNLKELDLNGLYVEHLRYMASNCLFQLRTLHIVSIRRSDYSKLTDYDFRPFFRAQSRIQKLILNDTASEMFQDVGVSLPDLRTLICLANDMWSFYVAAGKEIGQQIVRMHILSVQRDIVVPFPGLYALSMSEKILGPPSETWSLPNLRFLALGDLVPSNNHFVLKDRLVSAPSLHTLSIDDPLALRLGQKYLLRIIQDLFSTMPSLAIIRLRANDTIYERGKEPQASDHNLWVTWDAWLHGEEPN